MKKRNAWTKVVTLVSVLSLLLSFLCSCKQDPLLSQVSPMPLPDGAELIALYLHHEGMAMEPYYILQTLEQEICLKITDTSPLEYVTPGSEGSPYLSEANKVMEDEDAKMIFTDDLRILRTMEEILARYGAMNWDGFAQSKSKKSVLDSGDRYELYFELSDGTTVTVNSYNCCPAGFVELLNDLQEMFHTEFEAAN